jgi:hypothetical protein
MPVTDQTPHHLAAYVAGQADAGADPASIRTFATGATRSADAGRDDPEGFFSPLVIDRFNQYMTKHRVQADGGIRDSDNWQQGIPLSAYMKGLFRHFLHVWTRHRGWPVRDPKAEPDIEGDLCAVMFNAMGYLHEVLCEKIVIAGLDWPDAEVRS